MIITNRLKLPAPLVAAVTPTREPNPAQFSVTELLEPPQIRLLKIRHWGEIREDVTDRIWAACGTLMHTLLEQHGGLPEHHIERTLSTTVDGETVTGTFDLYHEDGTLIDWKFVSVWTTMRGVPADWQTQLNLYAELLRRTGFEVRSLKIVAIYRDWVRTKALYEHGYPAEQAQVFNIPLWTDEYATSYMSERIRLHRSAESGPSPQCTDEERWARRTKFALMKRGAKKALKLYDDEESANKAVTKPEHYVEIRPGGNARCENYCAVSEFCPQYARIRAEESGDHLPVQ